MRVVVKIGTSSLTEEDGSVRRSALRSLLEQLVRRREIGDEVVLVTSGAIAVGLKKLEIEGRPKRIEHLQAAAAVGQGELLREYLAEGHRVGLVFGQTLFAPHNFFLRSEYLQARATLETLLSLGVVPLVNENDAIADDEIRFGDNDRLAALIAHGLRADALILLTDTEGLYTADPRHHADATLVEEVTELAAVVEQVEAGGAGTRRGSGGMASKLSAARMASWAGVRAVIAQADREGVIDAALQEERGVGTSFPPKTTRLTARKLWLAFAMTPVGYLVVDDGAVEALRKNASLLCAGVVQAEGAITEGDGVEIRSLAGEVVGRGVSRLAASEVEWERGAVVVHRDDLVMF